MMLAWRLFPSLALLLWTTIPAHGFTLIVHRTLLTPIVQRRLSMSDGDNNNNNNNKQQYSRQEEIARLEAQLRQLKDEPPPPPKVEQEKAVAVALEKVKGKDMLLSEREVADLQRTLDPSYTDDDNNNTGSSSVIVSALAAVALAVGLFFFAQLPVGQEDLARYSASGSSSSSRSIDLGDMNPDRNKL